MERLTRILVSLALLLFLTSSAHAKTYKIGLVPWAGFSTASVAEAKGFWKEENADVQVFVFPNVQTSHSALKAKRLDLAFDMAGTAVGFYMSGLPVVFAAETDWSHGGDKVIVPQTYDKTVLKSKPIGVYLNQPPVLIFLWKYLKQQGIPFSDIQLVEMETKPLADNFIAGRVPLIVSYDPEAIRAEREGKGVVAATTADFPGVMPEGLIALRDVYDSIPKEDLSKIFRGLIRAAIWCSNTANTKEWMQIMNQKIFHESPYAEQDLLDMIKAVRIHGPSQLVERNRQGGGIYAYLEEMKTFLREANLFKKDFTPDAILATETMAAEAAKALSE